MDPETKSNEGKRHQETQECLKHILEETWDSSIDDTLCKIFSVKAKGIINDSINLSEEGLDSLRWKVENSDLSPLTKIYTNKIRSLKNCNVHRWHRPRDFPSKASNLRCDFTFVTREKWDTFSRDSEKIELL